ncbi:transcriptional regulator, IclR family [Natronorubrum sediminis]|uniref:Transcriptional regulator, IclR family n=1 Tax=Natronorubrum sediminis TaxID=640943 RepID=A0A1H6G4R8_9EURY|nr:IclR family transcriptional regulator [Natronorubrum sediminis]SEH18071.1 transcriptional regulator, IclR family [Natronorubrum sediminis]
MTIEVQSIERADRLLQTLVDVEGATASELADEVDMPLSSVYDYLTTFEELGYVVDSGNGHYVVSFGFLELGNRVRNQYDVYTVAESELKTLSRETGEYVVLMVEEDGLGVVIGLQKGDESSNIHIRRTHPGTKTRLSTTASGKSILAQLSDERVRELVDRYGLAPKTENTITDTDELFEELERIRDDCYAIDDEERFEGMRGVGAPVATGNESVTAGIAIYGPANRLTETVLHEEYSKRVLETANVIQVNLSYS